MFFRKAISILGLEISGGVAPLPPPTRGYGPARCNIIAWYGRICGLDIGELIRLGQSPHIRVTKVQQMLGSSKTGDEEAPMGFLTSKLWDVRRVRDCRTLSHGIMPQICNGS